MAVPGPMRRGRAYIALAAVGAVLIVGAATPQFLALRAGLRPEPATRVANSAPAATGTSNPAPSADDVLAAVNAARQENGLAPITRDAALDALATSLVERIAESGHVGHNDLDSALAGQALRDFRSLAESVYVGRSSTDAASVVEWWLLRPTHRANLLVARYDAGGIAIRVTGDRVWIVLDLAASW